MQIQLSALTLLLLSLTASAQTRIIARDGEVNDQEFGSRVVDAGDLNGDGVNDQAVASVNFMSRHGRVDVYSGLDGSLLWTDQGGDWGVRFGQDIAPAGDLNGDGYDDLIISASAETGHGIVRVLSGLHTISQLSPQYLLVLQGPLSSGQMGQSVLSPGDLDGDGVPDIVAGATAWNTRGAIYAFSGQTGSLLWEHMGHAVGNRLGADIALVDDLDGDGIPEIAAGAPGFSAQAMEAGLVRILSGATGIDLPAYELHGPTANARLGAQLAGDGDLNGDGRNELVVGAPFHSGTAGTQNEGQVFVVGFTPGSGTVWNVLWSRTGGVAGAQFGISLSTAGDVDGDGQADLLIGAKRAAATGGEEGVAHLFSGAELAPSSTPRILFVEGGGTLFSGAEVALIHDQNGDGLDDLMIGVRYSDDAGPDRGRMAVWSGSCGGYELECTSSATSTGVAAHMDMSGGTSISAGIFTLLGLDAVPAQPGIFFYSADAIEVPFGDGTRCVGGQIFRLGPPTTADSNGNFQHTIDFDSGVAASGAGQILAGSSWRFQLWFRDPAAAASGFNLSNALRITFCQ